MDRGDWQVTVHGVTKSGIHLRSSSVSVGSDLRHPVFVFVENISVFTF